MNYSRHLLLLALSFFLASCKTLPEGVSPHFATWLYGEHTLPSVVTKSGASEKYKLTYKNKDITDNADSVIKVGTKVPAVIYMHGCAGFSTEAYNFKKMMLSHGYAFFMPDSFARPDREKLCGTGNMSDRVAMRQREVSTSLKEIRKLNWVKQDQIILMGFSEGGNTTDSWYNDDFNALIIIGSACTNSGGSPSAPDNVPVLAIVGDLDDYRPGMSCNIKRSIGGSRSIVIKGGTHWISHEPETERAISEFLNKCCGNSGQTTIK